MKEYIRLMKKHGTFTQACISLALILALIGICINNPTYGNIVSLLTFALLFCWMCEETYLRERIDLTEGVLADAQDKLILAGHKVERLKQELEAAQSELAKQATHVQTGLAQIGQADEASAESPEAKPKPKRPAFKRKPRPKQTENENKD